MNERSRPVRRLPDNSSVPSIPTRTERALAVSSPRPHIVFPWRQALRADADVPAVPKSVGQALSYYVNPEGECWPGVDTIARDTGRHRRTVQRALRTLEVLGYVRTRKGGGRKHTSRYLIGFPNRNGDSATPLTADEAETAAESPKNVAESSVKGGGVPPELDRELERELVNNDGEVSKRCQDCDRRDAQRYIVDGYVHAYCRDCAWREGVRQ